MAQSRDQRPRIPGGQHLVKRLPVLHYGPVPRIDINKWEFRIFGLVEEEVRWTYPQLRALPSTRATCDIHCVTTWSMLDTHWEGVAVSELMKHVRVRPAARYVLVHAEQGWSTNLPLEDFLAPENLFAWGYEGQELAPEHGWPLRLVVPSLYFWKSAKWARAVEFLDRDVAGFWERAGYHMHGDPWREERYGG